MNRITLLGRLGSDPDVKIFDSGDKVVKFSFATSEKYKKNDETVESTEWHQIVFYGKSVDTIEKYLHKGDQALITGKVKYRNYEDRDGKTIWITEVIGDRFEFCGSPKFKEEKPKEKQSGPQYESGYSDIDDLPGYVAEQQEASQENEETPF
jgi:single-strand DNA-binding protein